MKANELLEKILPRSTRLPASSGLSFIEALNKVLDIFTTRLHSQRSSILIEEISGIQVSSEFVDLPSEFRGFEGTIYLEDTSENRYSLNIMPTTQYGADDGTEPPPYYRMVGPFRMQFGPPPDDDTGAYDDTYTLKGFWFVHPGTIELIDYLPWDELLDMEIEEGVLMALTYGTNDEAVVDSIGDLLDKKVSNHVSTPRRNAICPL